jgi:hypothetical protein
MKTTIQALKEYTSLATTEIRQGTSTPAQMVSKVHFLMNYNGYKVSKQVVKQALTWDKLDWQLKLD